MPVRRRGCKREAIRAGRVRDKVKDWPLVAFSKQPVNFMGKFLDNSRLERTAHAAKWQKRNLKKKKRKKNAFHRWHITNLNVRVFI